MPSFSFFVLYEWLLLTSSKWAKCPSRKAPSSSKKLATWPSVNVSCNMKCLMIFKDYSMFKAKPKNTASLLKVEIGNKQYYRY